MAGESFLLGEEKIRPGTYVRVTSGGEEPPAVLPRGIVAALVRSNWGPTVPTTLESEQQIASVFGDGGAGDTLDVIKRAFRGGARRVIAVRQGSGGALATFTITDGAGVPVNIVRLDSKHVGTRAFSFTLRTNLADATKRDFILFEGTTQIEAFTYTPGADEAQTLVDLINGSSSYLDATKLAVGDGSAQTYTAQALAGGADVTVDGAAQTAALTALDTQNFNALVIDAEDAVSQSLVEAQVDLWRSTGKRVMAVVGEDSTVPFATRETNARALNNKAVVYVGNGFTTAEGDQQGMHAAAQVAGMLVSAEITDSLTNAVVNGGSALVGALSNTQIESAIRAGMLVFTLNPAGQPRIEYGITSLSTPGAGEDSGWKKIRRVRTRDELVSQMVADSDSLNGRVNNDPAGRAALQARLQGAINRLVARGALLGGSVQLDAGNPAAGDSAWWLVSVDDLDSIEKLYLTFEFRFSAPSA